VFLAFFEREGGRQFRAEEELLLPAYARHGGCDRPEIVRVLTEHVDLRRRARVTLVRYLHLLAMARLALGGREHQARHDEQPRDQPYQSGHLDVSHAHTMSKRSVWTRSARTPSSTSAVSAASIMGPGPPMKTESGGSRQEGGERAPPPSRSRSRRSSPPGAAGGREPR
jgi:hypothetical protein